MYRWEIPSFSSSLLDEIYRSIDEEGGSNMPREQGFSANMVGGKKQSKCGNKTGEVESVKAGSWVVKKARDRESIQRRQVYPETEKKQRKDRCFDHDALFFSSKSSSSDSSSNGFSSSDTESAYSGVKTRVSCFVPLPRPKPVRTSVASRPDRTGSRTEFSPFQEQRKLPGFDSGDEGMINSKSRALKIYSNLKKMKRPISPGGKLASFINSLFTASNTPRKSQQSAMLAVPYSKEENHNGKLKSGDSSASSFSGSCLSKNSPVSVILDEDNRRCGEKSLHQEREESVKENVNKPMSVSFLGARNPGTNVHRKITDETRHSPRRDMSSQGEEAAREFLRNYHRNQKKIEKTATMTSRDIKNEDDASSCASSDLFELDHLSVLDNDMSMSD